MTSLLFALVGAAAGAAEVVLLARAARGSSGLLSLLGRLGLVGMVLVLAARADQLAWGAPGWIAGFVASASIVHGRLR